MLVKLMVQMYLLLSIQNVNFDVLNNFAVDLAVAVDYFVAVDSSVGSAIGVSLGSAIGSSIALPKTLPNFCSCW